MATHPLNLCADLMPWYNAGVSCLIFEENSPLQQALTPRKQAANAAAEAVTPAQQQNVARAAQADNANQQRGQSAPNVASGTTLEHGGGQNYAAHSSGARHNFGTPSQNADSYNNAYPEQQKADAHMSSAAGNANRQEASPSTHSTVMPTAPKAAHGIAKLPKEQWPEVWRTAIEARAKAPIIWSYKGLELDLAGTGNKNRSQILKTIIGALALPKGSSTFCPLSVQGLSPAEEKQNVAVYAAAIEELQGRVLIFFGQDSLQASGFGYLNLHELQNEVVDGRLIFVLPTFENIMEKPAILDSVTVLLKAALSRINFI